MQLFQMRRDRIIGLQSLLSTGRKRLASQFNFTYRYIDDVLSINNPDFENYLGQMYPPELEIKDTTESNISASYLDLLLSIGRDGQLHTSLYDKRDDFNFHITNFLFLRCSRVGARTGTLKNPAKCLWRGSPTVGTTSSSVRLHIYVPSHM